MVLMVWFEISMSWVGAEVLLEGEVGRMMLVSFILSLFA